ncbi:MAG: ELM1/GtrOC1 family putative glycosyltransferase [Wenzhouxiangellaceae bacterium]|nr:ELM1/GtrOC1 family putative glycosyltransferase [Wenzhouxiangellaceae bacterium]
MSDSSANSSGLGRASAWVLAAPGAGDNRQLEALVKLFDIDARWISDFDGVGRVLFDRLQAPWSLRMPPDKAGRFEPPWPNLVLLAGGRSVVDARRIRQASQGRSKIVCLGRPWAPLDWFDLVVTTPQYRLPAADNVLTLDLPLNLPEPSDPSQLEYWCAQFESLPRPLIGVLLGGASGSYAFPASAAAKLAGRLNEVLVRAGGSAVIVASPRTPDAAMARISAEFQAPGQVYGWHPSGGPNPFRALLALADGFVVTGDSASMLADAVFTGRPVSVFDLPERGVSRCNRAVRALTRGLEPVQQRLARRGWWIPARDMRLVHAGLKRAGHAVALDALPNAPAASAIAVEAMAQNLRQRISGLLEPGRARPTALK